MNIGGQTLSNVNLMDLGFEGHPFTWSNGREGSANIHARLDRALGNPGFQNRFSPIKITHLPRFRPDHAVILIHLEASLGRDSRQKPKIFRFEESWSHQNNYEQAVRRLWSHNGNSVFEKCGHMASLASEFQDHNLGTLKKEITKIEKLLKDKSLWSEAPNDIQR